MSLIRFVSTKEIEVLHSVLNGVADTPRHEANTRTKLSNGGFRIPPHGIQQRALSEIEDQKGRYWFLLVPEQIQARTGAGGRFRAGVFQESNETGTSHVA